MYMRITAGFQNDYLEQKPRYEASYKEAKKAFSKLKGMLPLLRGEFTDGYDILDDILDFFGVDSETEIFDNSEKEAALFRKQNNTEVDASIFTHGYVEENLIFKNSTSLNTTRSVC